MERGGPNSSSDCCGVIMLLLWVVLTFGGVLLPETWPCCSQQEDNRSGYAALRQVCGKPVLGALTMATAMPIYVGMLLTAATVQQIWNLAILTWETSAGKVLFTLGGWLLPQLATETEDEAYMAIR
eukprot:COSAG02_NODE_1087_length_14672_cov_189.858437_16_plen_125_part_01